MTETYTPAEKNAVKYLTRKVNSTPEFWRGSDGILRARTGQWLYIFNASEGRWNTDGKTA